MFRALVLVAVAGCAASQPHSTINWPEKLDHTSTPATHKEAALLAVDASGSREMMTAMVNVSLEQQIRLKPILKPYEQVLRQFLSKYLSYEALRDAFAEMYMARFDELQLRQMAAFYQTPTGKVAITKVGELATAGAELGRKRVEEHQAELVDAIRNAAQPEPQQIPKD